MAPGINNLKGWIKKKSILTPDSKGSHPIFFHTNVLNFQNVQNRNKIYTVTQNETGNGITTEPRLCGDVSLTTPMAWLNLGTVSITE